MSLTYLYVTKDDPKVFVILEFITLDTFILYFCKADIEDEILSPL